MIWTKILSTEAIEVRKKAKIVTVRKLWELKISSYNFFYQVKKWSKKIKEILRARVNLKQSYHNAPMPITWKRRRKLLSGLILPPNRDCV